MRKQKLRRLALAAALLAALALMLPLAAQAESGRAIRYTVPHVTQAPSGCYTASVAMCGLWNGSLQGTPEEAYQAVWESNGNSVFVRFATLDRIGYRQTTDTLTLEALYDHLANGPVIVGEKSAGSMHYAVVYGYDGSAAALSEAGFLVLDPTAPVWRLSDHAKLSEDGTTTLDRWIAGSAYLSYTYAVSPAPEQEARSDAEPEVRFVRTAEYRTDRFTDVSPDQWFAGSVAAAFELGLMKGNSDTTFAPYGDVTLAEAVTVAARIHSIAATGSENFVQQGAWYQVYLDYALQNGIIDEALYLSDVSRKATRAQFAEILAQSLPRELLPAINAVADGGIPDVSMNEPYADAVYLLYRAGVLTGRNAAGAFLPQAGITRAEAAAVVSRMAESDSRVRIAPI